MMAISLLVLLHEGGHMFFAKLFGIKVDKFYVFFDVGIGKWTGSLFRFKPKHSDTEYGIGWLPFGGYCKNGGREFRHQAIGEAGRVVGVSIEARMAASIGDDWRCDG